MNASINDNPKPTLSHETGQHIKLLERRFRALKGSVEMLTVFERPNSKSAQAMVEDAQALLDVATKLHTVLSAIGGRQ